MLPAPMIATVLSDVAILVHLPRDLNVQVESRSHNLMCQVIVGILCRWIATLCRYDFTVQADSIHAAGDWSSPDSGDSPDSHRCGPKRHRPFGIIEFLFPRTDGGFTSPSAPRESPGSGDDPVMTFHLVDGDPGDRTSTNGDRHV